MPPLSFGHFPRERGKTWDSATFYQCKHARDFRLQQLVLEIHPYFVTVCLTTMYGSMPFSSMVTPSAGAIG